MKQTTILFLRSYASANQFRDALAWVKAKPRRLFLNNSKLWVLDTQVTPTDPAWTTIIEEVKKSGWIIAGESLWPEDLSLKENAVALDALATLVAQREAETGTRRPRR